MDIKLALMSGVDIPIPECQLIVHQPTIREISFIGETDFWIGIQLLCINKDSFLQDETPLVNTSNFQILMTIVSEKETKDKKVALEQLLKLIFPTYKITFTPRSILFTKDSVVAVLDENTFDIFQETVKSVFCVNAGHGGQESFNTTDPKAAEIAKKLMRGRQRVAAQRGSASTSSLSQYISTIVIGVNSMSLKDVLDLTLYQLYDLVERYSLYINWDIDIRSRLAGATPEGQPENWMKNIH